VILSPAEVAVQSTPNLKHPTIIMTIYAAGLRVPELINLRVTDIDSQRQLIRIGQAKGHKDRQVMFSPKLLEALWTYWKRMGRSRVGPSNKWRLSIHGPAVQVVLEHQVALDLWVCFVGSETTKLYSIQ
jgi:site-specific recombinase XerD